MACWIDAFVSPFPMQIEVFQQWTIILTCFLSATFLSQVFHKCNKHYSSNKQDKMKVKDNFIDTDNVKDKTYQKIKLLGTGL